MLKNLISDLTQLTTLRKEGFEEEVRIRLAAYVSSGATDWMDYKFTNPLKYSRNLVEINREYEMIVLCWEAGQASPIHNHSVRDFEIELILLSTSELKDSSSPYLN